MSCREWNTLTSLRTHKSHFLYDVYTDCLETVVPFDADISRKHLLQYSGCFFLSVTDKYLSPLHQTSYTKTCTFFQESNVLFHIRVLHLLIFCVLNIWLSQWVKIFKLKQAFELKKHKVFYCTINVQCEFTQYLVVKFLINSPWHTMLLGFIVYTHYFTDMLMKTLKLI